MAYEIPDFALGTLEAGADLSGAQYKIVKLDASGNVVVCAAVTDIPLGVLQNDPLAGEAATVMVSGVTKIQADAALVPGNQIGTSADGQAAVKVAGTNTTHYVIGQVLQGAGAADALATALIDCAAPHRAA